MKSGVSLIGISTSNPGQKTEQNFKREIGVRTLDHIRELGRGVKTFLVRISRGENRNKFWRCDPLCS